MLLLSPLQPLLAQDNVGIGTGSPNSNALLDLTVPDPASRPQGLLVPRLTNTQMSNLGTNMGMTEKGMVVMDTTNNLLMTWDGLSWTIAGTDDLP